MQNLIDSGMSGRVNCGNKTTTDKMIKTFNATGCPNPNVNTGWWATQSKATVLNDMNAYCTLTNKGTANSRQKSMCCGKDNVNCGRNLIAKGSQIGQVAAEKTCDYSKWCVCKRLCSIQKQRDFSMVSCTRGT